MDQLAERLQQEKIGSFFIYTHEAHPGEFYGHHQSLEQKLRHAREFKEYFDLQRPLYIDQLSGDCHRYFGSMPNMTWIISRSGQIIYKADWTDVRSIESCLNDFLHHEEERRSSRRLSASFNVSRLDFRLRDKPTFIRHLREIAGPRAEKEYTDIFGKE